jgi:hypothetical protein
MKRTPNWIPMSIIFALLCASEPRAQQEPPPSVPTSFVKPQNEGTFDKWLPSGNLDDQTQAGNHLAVKVWWDCADPLPPNFPPLLYMQVNLLGVTSYKGVAGNRGDTTDPDYRIRSPQAGWTVSANGQSARSWFAVLRKPVPHKYSAEDQAQIRLHMKQ